MHHAEPAPLALMRDWCNASAPQRQGMIQVEGAEAVRWLLRSPVAIHAVLGKESTLTSLRPDIEAVPEQHIIVRSRREIAEIVGFPFDRGVLAVAAMPAYMPMAQLRDQCHSGNIQRLIICDAVHDAINVGAIMRSARCLGLDAVVMGPGCADPWSRRCIRVGVGHPLCMRISASTDLPADLGLLRAAGVEIIAAHRGPLSQPLEEVAQVRTPWAVVVGNEDRGPRPEVVSASSQQRHIPMHDATDSLNVAMAATVFMHHLRGQETALTVPSHDS